MEENKDFLRQFLKFVVFGVCHLFLDFQSTENEFLPSNLIASRGSCFKIECLCLFYKRNKKFAFSLLVNKLSMNFLLKPPFWPEKGPGAWDIDFFANANSPCYFYFVYFSQKYQFLFVWKKSNFYFGTKTESKCTLYFLVKIAPKPKVRDKTII